MEAGSRAQSAGLAWLEQCQALLEASKASWPSMPILIKPLQLQELEAKIDELHQELEGIDSDDEDSEAQRQAKQESLVALESELRPLKTDWDRTCRDAHVAYRPEDEMKANSLMNNFFNLYKDFGLPINGNMGVDTSALGLPGDSPDADPDTPRRPRMRMKRGGAVLTPDRNGVFESETRKKRKRGPSSAISHKRPRIQGNRNSIHFNAVYQNRRAAKKHTIIRVPKDEDPVRPAKFYILRCEHHDIDFNDNPLQAGSAHLSESHQHENPSFETVVQHFGYEVIGCDDEKLIQNNKTAKEAFENGERGARDFIRVTDSPSPKTRRKNASKAVKKGRSNRMSRNPINPRDLVPGDVYIIYWSASKQWYCGLYIPLQDPESVGIDESLEALGLLNNIPPCYEYDSSSKSFSWAEGYEDGGEDASEQQFPFMFFEGLDFPDLCHVAWIPVDEIQPWDEDKALMIEHSDQAFEYLKQREAAQQPKRLGPNDEISDSGDDNSTSDLAPRSPVAESSTDFQPAQNAEAVTPNTAPEADAADEAEDADVTGQTDETLKDTEGAPEEEQDTQSEPEEAQETLVEPEETQGAQMETEEAQDTELETEDEQDVQTELVEAQKDARLESGEEQGILPEPEEVQNDATLESGEVQKNIQMEVEEAPDTEPEPDKVAESPVQPEIVEDEDIAMSSEESPTESAAQQATQDSEDVVMETPGDSTPEPLQQNDSQSDRDDQEIILDTQEDPAENVSSSKEPEEVTAERKEREQESSSHETREERLPSVDLADLLTAGEDLELQFSQSEQRELDQRSTPTPAHETTSPSRAVNDVVNTKQEQSWPASPTPETASVTRTETDSEHETREASQPQRSSVATESSNDETPRPRLSYAEMGRASSLSEGVPSDVVDSRPQIQPASRRARSGTPNRNALAAQPRMSSLSKSPVVSRPPAMSPPATIPFSPTAPSASTPLQLPMMSQPPPSSQSSVIRSPTSQRPPSGLQHPVSSWPLDNSWASTTPQRLGPSQSSALARRPAPSQPTVASQPPQSSQPSAARPSTLSRPPSSSQPSPSEPPFRAPTTQMGPEAQVAMSPGPAVSNGERPHDGRPTSQTSQVLAPPRHSQVESPLLEDAQNRSEVLRHPHAAQPKAPAQALGNSPRSNEFTRPIEPKAPSKPTVEIVLLNRQAVNEARLQSMTTGQQAAATSPTQMPAAHERHSEPAQITPTPPVMSAVRLSAPAARRPLPQERPSPRPSASPVKRREAPKAMPSQKQAPSPSSQHPSGAENTPAAQPERPAQIPSSQPPARYASRPTSPVHQNSPRLPPMNVPLEGHYLPNTMLAQQQASLSRPSSSGHVGLQPMPSPRLAARSISRPGSASQIHIRSQAMPSPHQLAADIQRPQSRFQGHPGSQPMYSPRQVPGEIPHHAPAYEGHPNHRPAPSPRRPYAVPVQPPPSPHQPFSHFPHRSPEMQGNGYVSQRHASTGTLSPQSSTAENQLPPIRLPDISRPRSEAHTGSNMISPPQTAVGLRPGHYTGHQQPTPPVMQSPRLSAAEISRPHTASNMRPPLATMSPILGHTEPRRPNSSYSQAMPFHAPLPTMLPNYSSTGYQSSAPSAHQYAQPNRPQGHLRRHSESACQPQLQQYALAGSPQIANSTPRSYQSHELDQGPRRNPALDPFLPELSPNVRKALLEQVNTERPDLVPCDFLTNENRYRCPFCKETTLEPTALIDHIKMSCPMLEEKYKQDKIEQVFEANQGKRVKPAKRKSQMAQTAKNARVRS
ncbi:hypothetical protein FACUT_3870 [Fusarium acutatum]|uniref:Uncharacterized protein n=1 Tax=Fusarium acutatum TaxID=78861 RepID=A0A8H4NNZ0_9HYPO|nr:hypothetical protein FACUT_3870 [Fusarium acutatum]